MIPAIVLAAGLSQRMGRFKLTLPWGETTVIGQVIAALEAAGLKGIIVVTGHRAAEVTAAIAGTAARAVHNPDYAAGEMLSSIQCGLQAIAAAATAAVETAADRPGQVGTTGPALRPPAVLLCLGDQPQIRAATVRAVLAAGEAEGWSRIVIPSYQMRGGHPILLPAWLWSEVLACQGTLRTVLAAHRNYIHYLAVDTPTVLADLDTPADYEAGRQQLEA